MRSIQSATPDAALLDALSAYQNEVDQEPDYSSRVDKARELWDLRHSNRVLSKLRDLLLSMCTEDQCMYCERSVSNQLEHFHPKAFYPEVVFSWDNYLYICSPCNRKKWDNFAIFSSFSGDRVDLRRGFGEPEPGRPLLINPREEDPLDLLLIDLQDTGTFLPRAAAGTPDWLRADYTARELLDLNSASHRKARRIAYHNFKLVLRDYIRTRNEGGATDKNIDVITQSPHPGVWAAMKRDRAMIPELQILFEAAPEALNW
jgi:uncharacterized protein (TIGR02646 family)